MRAKIQTRGYWRVVIRPANFQQVRVKNVLDLKRILESSAVHFRGWDFPHVDYESDPEIGEDWVSQGIDWEMYVEYWRFYQSGQFLHLDGFKEDWLDGVRQLSVREKWPPRERLAVVKR